MSFRGVGVAKSVHRVLVCRIHKVLLVNYVSVMAAAFFVPRYPNTCLDPGNL